MIQTNVAFEVTADAVTYLDDRMQDVSRSFALVVPWLDKPLNRYLAIAYLLCRVVDNIEDCRQPGAWKQQRLAEAAQLLEQPGLAPEVLAQWQQQDWPGLTPPERQLMDVSGGLPLWQIYAAIPTQGATPIMRSPTSSLSSPTSVQIL